MTDRRQCRCRRRPVAHPSPVIAATPVKNIDKITLQMLVTAHAGDEGYYRTILPHLNAYARAFEVDTKLRIAHFLAQVGHESGFKATGENLNYSEARMKQIFGCKDAQQMKRAVTDTSIVAAG